MTGDANTSDLHATATVSTTIPTHQATAMRAKAKASAMKNTAHTGDLPKVAPAKHAKASGTRGATASKCLHFLCTHSTIQPSSNSRNL